MNNIAFAELSEKYLDEITKLDSLCFKDKWSRAIFENELSLKSSYCLIALSDDELIAFCTVSTVLDGADITKLAVRCDFRRQGIAAELIDRICSYCSEHGINIINLELRESNSSAFRLYSRKGFETVGERKKYYDNFETAILMTKILKEV